MRPGRRPRFTYNAAGQVLTATNAKQETTTYAYDPDGRLQSVTGPVAGATTSYTYDGYGRVRTVTGPDGYTVTTDYDLFDRPTRVTYPDGTYEETTYDRLDVSTRRDRLGRITRYFYDALAPRHRHARSGGPADPAAVGRGWPREAHRREGADDDLGTGRAGAGDAGGAGRRGDGDRLHVSAAPAGGWRR